MNDPTHVELPLARTDGASISLVLDASKLELALNALDALAEDDREPERYRQWYADAAADIRRQTEAQR